MEAVLNNSLILRKIFQNISSTELLELSLVNKQWNHETRSLMRSRGDLIARINKAQTSQDLTALASDLRRMKEINQIIPFSGMNIALKGFHWGHKDWCQKSSTGELDKDSEDILEEITWKNLAVSFNWNWDECQDCTAYLLVEKIFQNHCSTLEKLSLQVEYNRGDFIETVLPGCSFPSLKTFELQKPEKRLLCPNATSEDDTNLIKKMISVAPNLHVLYTEDRVDLGANLLEGSSAVHVTDYVYCSHRDEIPLSVIGELKLKRMKLDSSLWQFNLERFNIITSTLLQNSRTTLSSMEIESIFLVPLTSYRFCLQNVRKFDLRFSKTNLESQSRFMSLLKSFDFTRKIPNLSAVQISWTGSSDFRPVLNAFNLTLEQANAELIEPLPDRAANIKNLSLQWPARILDYSTEFLVQMFPEIQKLSIRAQETIPFTCIWDSWLDLKELDITLQGFRDIEKFDSAFCGIFPQEVALLQEQDEEYLRKVNIVPVMPSITCLKGLRTFNLYFEDLYSFDWGMDYRALVFSKVAGLVAFQRCPTLTVTLTTNNEWRKRALNHMQPYASVILLGPDSRMSVDCLY